MLEAAAGRLYSNAAAHGRLPVDDPRLLDGGEFDQAAELLLDLGLFVTNAAGTEYLPVDPSTVQNRVVVPMSREGADLLTESAEWAEAFASLGQTYRRATRGEVAPITELRGIAQIDNFLQALVGDSRSEILAAQPYGRRPADALAKAENRDLRALQRGIKMRTLYQHSARQSPATREYVAEMTAHGAEVRTLDEFFKRLIIVDREVAVIPGSEDHAVAIALREKSTVAYLVDIFERSWERGRPFTAHEARNEKAIASDVRAMTIRLLVEGHSDPASAKRLGVSTRTYAGYIAALKEEYGVQTRFQLGHAMGRAAAPADTSEKPADVSEEKGASG
ncbi:MAG TPA: LuxR family transcriptional regulator [Nocardioidaceae bacterium]|nr:LuxR family transcriptional regulator [Nocardioidaceae bacterium]